MFSYKNQLSPYYVTAWDVKQYVYCPTIPWIKVTHGVVEPPTISMELGKPKNPSEEFLIKLGLPKPLRYEVKVKSVKHGVAGVVDVVCGLKKLEVVEFKNFPRKKYEHFTSQTLFYAYLVNVALGPVFKAHLILKDFVRTYAITLETLKRVERLVSEVRESMNSEKPPKPQVRDRLKCAICWYRRYCPWL